MTQPAALLTALAFAAERHRNQRRKGPDASPAVNHVLEVAAVLATTGGVRHEALLLAALLHDTVEDTETTPAGQVERFGERVAALGPVDAGLERRFRTAVTRARERFAGS